MRETRKRTIQMHYKQYKLHYALHITRYLHESYIFFFLFFLLWFGVFFSVLTSAQTHFEMVNGVSVVPHEIAYEYYEADERDVTIARCLLFDLA